MIKDFLIINFTGKNNSIGLRTNNNFFTQQIQTKINNNEILVNTILQLLLKKNVKIDDKFSIIVNNGPGSFSAIRTSLSIAKGIKIACGASIYGYKDFNLTEFTLKNIELLIKNGLLENKLIKPVYIS